MSRLSPIEFLCFGKPLVIKDDSGVLLQYHDDMVKPDDLSQWLGAVTELIEIANTRFDYPGPDNPYGIRGLLDARYIVTHYDKLIRKACRTGIDPVPFCGEYDFSTFRIFLDGYTMLQTNPDTEKASHLFMEVVQFIHRNRPHTMHDKKGLFSRVRFLMYVLMIGCKNNDQIVLEWFHNKSNDARLYILQVMSPSWFRIAFKFIEIDEFSSYIADSFEKLVEVVGTHRQQIILQYFRESRSQRCATPVC